MWLPIRIFLVLICFGLIFCLGYYYKTNDYFFSRIFNSKQDFSAQKYPVDVSDLPHFLTSSYKTISSTIYIVLHIILNVLIIYLIFLNKKCVITMAGIYGFIFIMSLIFVLLGSLLKDYRLGIGLVQNIKKIINSPIIAMIMTLYFFKIQRDKTT